MKPRLIRELPRINPHKRGSRDIALYECPICKQEFTGVMSRIKNGQATCSVKCGRIKSVAGQPRATPGKTYTEFSPVDFKRICKHLNISRANYNDKDLVLLWNERTDETLPRLEDKGKDLEILGEGANSTLERLKEIYG